MKNKKDKKQRRSKEEIAREKKEKKKIEDKKNRMNQLQVAKFNSFFVNKQKKITKEIPMMGQFLTIFELQKDQSMANYVPEISKNKFDLNSFDSKIIQQNTQLLYLDDIKTKSIVPVNNDIQKQQKSTNQTNDDINVFQFEHKIYRAKLLQFDENLRPPYFGTWRKKSKLINERNPFRKDENWFNYDVEYDLEWEEEEEGEIIKDSDSEKDKLENKEDDYELDEFFVSNDHLSDDENQDEHCELIKTPDQKKRKLLTKGKILVKERKKI